MNNEITKPSFDTISYVGLPSRQVVEPTALEQVYVLVASAYKSRGVAKSLGKREPGGHRFEVFDLPQVLNTSVGEKDGVPVFPPDVETLLDDFGNREDLKERWQRLKPIAERVMKVHRAIIDALKLEEKLGLPITTASMVEDPEGLFHSSLFKGLLARMWQSNWASQQSKVIYLGQEPGTVSQHLERNVPLPYYNARRSRQPQADGLLTYGLLEVAALIESALQGITVFQYGHSREIRYAHLAGAILTQLLGEQPDVAGRIAIIRDAVGLQLTGCGEADCYRMSKKDMETKKRLPINPPPALDDLKKLLLNGEGKFDQNKREFIRIAIFKLLAMVVNISEEETATKKEIRRLYNRVKRHDGNLQKITLEDADKILGLLHRLIVIPISDQFKSKGILWIPEGASDEENENTPPAPSSNGGSVSPPAGPDSKPDKINL